MELGKQQQQFAYLQAKDLVDTVEGVLNTHDIALWNGNDTSLAAPTTLQYFGAVGQIQSPAGSPPPSGRVRASSTVIKSAVAQMVANSNFQVRPTAIYANPVLLGSDRPGDEDRVQRGLVDRRSCTAASG